MSSTNRGSLRRPQDLYSTPEGAFKPLLPILIEISGGRRILFWEPACGDRRLIKWMVGAGLEAGGDDLAGGYDFLKDHANFDVIVTNPPFSLAQEFCAHALNRARDVFMLLRINFLGSQKRREWWVKNEPNALFVLSERPDFTGEGGDSCEYAWFYWGRHFVGIHHL